MHKTAATPEEILRWLLGSATVGATARLGLAAANQEFGKRDPLKPDTDLYDPSIDVPVRMSPQQYQKYLQLKAQAGGPVKVAMWDNSIAAATMVGGGALGWHVVNKLIERKRKKQLQRELEDVKGELTQLTMPASSPKVAAAWEFLEKAAEEHCGGKRKRLVKAMVKLPKTAGTKSKLMSALKSLQGKVEENPATALALGGTAGLAGLASLPGVREAINPVGSGVASGAGSALKTVLSPLGHSAAAVLGPVATLGLLYGVSKGFDQLSSQNPRKLELAAMRKRIREEEARATPYFELKPELVDEEPVSKRSKKLPAAEAVGARYQDVDAARDAARG